jgi:hypothetical protein
MKNSLYFYTLAFGLEISVSLYQLFLPKYTSLPDSSGLGILQEIYLFYTVFFLLYLTLFGLYKTIRGRTQKLANKSFVYSILASSILFYLFIFVYLADWLRNIFKYVDNKTIVLHQDAVFLTLIFFALEYWLFVYFQKTKH